MADIGTCTGDFNTELCGINVTINPQTNAVGEDDKVLILGMMGVGATAAPNTVLDTLDGTYLSKIGATSMLAQMVSEFKEKKPSADVCVYTVANDLDKSTTEVKFTTAATTPSGAIILWVNGQSYSVPFVQGVDADADIASRMQAIIAATDNSLVVTAAGDTLTIETVYTGAIGGFLDVRSEYSVDTLLLNPDDITILITPTVTAVSVPDLTAFETEEHGAQFVLNPFTDAASLASVDKYACKHWGLVDNAKVYGVFYGTQPDAAATGLAQNTPFLSYPAIKGALTPPYLETVTYGCEMYSRLNCQSGTVANSVSGVVMDGFLAPEPADRFTGAEKANLVQSGMGYFDVNARTNEVVIGRAVTTYTTSGNGVIDQALRDVNKPAILACLSSFFRTELLGKYQQYSFRSDGVIPPNSTNVATLLGVRNFVISLAQQASNDNLIQNLAGFIESMVVELDDGSGCISVRVDPELVCAFCCLNLNIRSIS